MGVLTEAYDIQKHCELLTEHTKTSDGKSFSVEYKDDIPAPYTSKTKDNIKLVLPTFNSEMTETDIKTLRGWIAHEVAHHTEGYDIWPLSEKYNISAAQMDESPLAALLALFEDNRIERKASEKYRGDAIALDECREIILNKIVGNSTPEGGIDKGLDVLRASMAIDMESRASWGHSDALLHDKFLYSMPKEVKEMVTKLRDAGFIDVLRNMNTAEEVFDASKKAFELLMQSSAENELKKIQQQAQKEGKDGEGEGKEKGANGKGEKSGGEFSAEGGTVNYTDYLLSDHKEWDVGGSGIHLDYTNYEKEKWQVYNPCPIAGIHVAWMNKNKYSNSGMKRYAEDKSVVNTFSGYRESVHSKHGMPGTGFGNKIRRLLQIKSQAHYVGGHKQGRLHKKTAYKVGCPTVGDGQWNQRVFRQKHQSDILDVAVTVLTDFSGSMMGDKIAHAIDSAMLLNDSIALSLRIPTEILGFTEYNEDCMIGVAKEFDERIATDKLIDNLCRTGGFMSNNADGEAIMWAYQRLKTRKEKRKILIVLSDGSPASSRDGDAMAFTQKIVKDIESDAIVEIVGIGIMDRNVQLIYKDNETIKKASDLEHAVLNVIKRKIIV